MEDDIHTIKYNAEPDVIFYYEDLAFKVYSYGLKGKGLNYLLKLSQIFSM